MDLSIIIVNWNTRDLLRNCLRSIAVGSEHYQVETIVVDNNSTDGSREMVAADFPVVKLLNSGANVGFAKANNLGLRYAHAPLILFLNPDTELRDQSLSRMIRFMSATPTVGALGCKVRDLSGEVQQLGLQWFASPLTELLRCMAISERTGSRLPWALPYHDPETSGYVKKLYGACLLVRRSVLDEVGAFDERFFMYCEDADLCCRIGRTGWRLFYLADAEILHLGAGASAGAASSFSILMMCESCSRLMRKRYGRLGSVLYRWVMALGAPSRVLVMLCIKASLGAFSRFSQASINASISRYWTITKWALGLQRPIIKGRE